MSSSSDPKGKGPAPTDSDTVAPNLLPIANTIFRENRARFVELLRRTNGPSDSEVVLVHAPAQQCVHDSDRELLYRPESNFFYLTGCEIPDARVLIEVATGRTTLLVPRLPESYAVWVGPIPKAQDYIDKHGVDAVRYADEAADVIAELGAKAVHVLDGTNTDSGSRVAAAPEADDVAAKAGARVERGQAYPALAEARVFKSEAELEVLRWVNKVTAAAHVSVMQVVRPGMAEFQMESRFLHEIYSKGGARFTA
jgi:Xaa-Pro dipeptidase